MKIIRFQLKRFIVVFILAVIVITIHILRSSQENDADTTDCFLSSETLKKIEDLLGLTKKPLEDLRLTHFLCYNSLWGALKQKGPLPWQTGLELCVLNKEMAAVDEGFLVRTFKRHGLNIAYVSASGYYKVSKIDEPFPVATLTVFEEDPITHQMRRVGWIHRMIPPNQCDELNCFPLELIMTPLPLVTFGEHNVPAPRDGIEMQKYLFPDSWWKEITPPNCQKKGE